MLTNVVRITSGNDSDPSNNIADVRVRVPLLPPVIINPIPGTTCNGDLKITGQAQPVPGLTVDIFVDDGQVATVTPDANGAWSHEVTGLSDGDHFIFAVARYNGQSAQSSVVKVIVNSQLTWHPISLRFIRENGRAIIPKDTDGRLDETGWRVFLRPGQTYQVSVEICCSDPDALVTLKIPGGEVITLTDPDDDKTFEGVFTMPNNPGSFDLVLCVTCNLIRHCSDGAVLIDPEGAVFDALLGKETGKLAGATATCYQAQTSVVGEAPSFSVWPADQFGQENPQTTGADGYYSFFTPAGVYQVEVIRSGYQSYRSPDLVVTDAPVEFDVPLTPEITDPTDHIIFISDVGFDPPVLVIKPGDVVEWVNVDGQTHTSTSSDPAAQSPTGTSGWDSGLLDTAESYRRQLLTPGAYTYYDIENPILNAQVIVETSTTYLPIVVKSSK